MAPPSNPSAHYLAYLGRLNHDKGIDLAVQIALDVGIPLKIAGPVRPAEKEAFILYNEKVRPYLGRHIQHIGEISDHEKSEFLGNALALLVPNRWDEPFGIVMAEALACGTPIIGTNTGSIPEIVQSGLNGYVCDSYGDMLAAVSSLSAISREACRDIAVSKFDVEPFIDQVLAMYAEVCESAA